MPRQQRVGRGVGDRGTQVSLRRPYRRRHVVEGGIHLHGGDRGPVRTSVGRHRDRAYGLVGRGRDTLLHSGHRLRHRRGGEGHHLLGHGVGRGRDGVPAAEAHRHHRPAPRHGRRHRHGPITVEEPRIQLRHDDGTGRSGRRQAQVTLGPVLARPLGHETEPGQRQRLRLEPDVIGGSPPGVGDDIGDSPARHRRFPPPAHRRAGEPSRRGGRVRVAGDAPRGRARTRRSAPGSGPAARRGPAVPGRTVVCWPASASASSAARVGSLSPAASADAKVRVARRARPLKNSSRSAATASSSSRAASCARACRSCSSNSSAASSVVRGRCRRLTSTPRTVAGPVPETRTESACSTRGRPSKHHAHLAARQAEAAAPGHPRPVREHGDGHDRRVQWLVGSGDGGGADSVTRRD